MVSRLSFLCRHAALLALPFAAAACAPRTAQPNTAPAAMSAARDADALLARVGAGTRVLDAARGTEVSLGAMLDALAGADVVFVGEQHDDPATHRLELAVLEGLARRGRAVTLSLEMFERDVQPALDAYLAGRSSETAMLAESRPWPNYATDYRPLVEFARERGWPVVAANVPRPLAAAVARGGLAVLDTLPAERRAHVAAELLCPDGAYRRKFVETMSAGGMHGASHGGAADSTASAAAAALLERIYQAQCVKDETMAESLAQALAPERIIVHVNGAFHSDERLGTVERLLRRRPGARVLVVSAVPVPAPGSADVAGLADRGDYVVVVKR
ncbi:MAG TPA: ChaN family lipoprotein [Gemmatimonadaceae bacterium]|nr:ChaN family lipoprotein [Gemmatimonadaceae bacterium]